MANKSQSDYEQRHEGEMSRRRILSYLVGAGAVGGMGFLINRCVKKIESVDSGSMSHFLRFGEPSMIDKVRSSVSLLDKIQPAETYYTISTLNDLLRLSRNHRPARYVLLRDIDCGGQEIEPIGTNINPFYGIFDGQGYRISNFRISKPRTSYLGLFGYVKSSFTPGSEVCNGIVANLAIENASVTGFDNVGVLAGRLDVAAILNCSVTKSSVDGRKTVGLLVGQSTVGFIKSSSAYGFVKCDDYGGEMVGVESSSVIEDCFTDVIIDCKGQYRGGLSGLNEDRKSVV